MANNYMTEYQKWLDSGVLTEAEHAELVSIKDDPKEIEARFYGAFGIWHSRPPRDYESRPASYEQLCSAPCNSRFCQCHFR